jgi:2'-5' RNA ligase
VGRRNIGVAIAVPDPHAAELQEWRRRLGDPSADRIPPHVTLLPPTAISDESLRSVEDHLAAVARELAPFDLVLRGSGTFRPVSPVTFVQVAAGIAECERLEARVRSGPLERPLKFPYHPHVTVAQDVPDEALQEGFTALAGYSAAFRVEAFGLFEQGRDRVWRPQLNYPLGATRSPADAGPSADGW